MRIPPWLFVFGLVLFVGVTGIGAVLSFAIARQVAIDSATIFEDSPLDFSAPPPTLTPLPAPTQVAQAGATSLPPTPIPAGPTATPDPLADLPTWTDTRRINILLMGIDQRSGVQDPDPYRTDTLILVSIDPVAKSAGVLSIPRDLWVNVPGSVPATINTAYSVGEANAYPGGGPALAAETVRQLLGIRVDKYVLINFDVFLAVVRAVAPGGTEICVRDSIYDPTYPDAGLGTIEVRFDPGCQMLDAERLLQYARTRATQGSDFDRAARQQEVLRALREQVVSAGGIANFIGGAPTLWNEVSASVRTNLSFDEILQLGALMGDIPRERIQFGQIDNLYVTFAKTNTGKDVLIPNVNAIRVLLQQVFNPTAELTISDLRQRAEAEGASIVIFNNTTTNGLAISTRDWLSAKGVTIQNVGSIEAPSGADTVIQLYSGNLWTARYLAALMGLPPERIRPGSDGLTSEDIAVLVGPDITAVLNSP
jgi:LCP family protein required for cell wall assembly